MQLKLSVAYCPLTLPQERGIYTWSTGSWKRRMLLAPDPKHAGKKLAAGLMAVSGVSHRRAAVQQYKLFYISCIYMQPERGIAAKSASLRPLDDPLLLLRLPPARLPVHRASTPPCTGRHWARTQSAWCRQRLLKCPRVRGRGCRTAGF
jgi:hypothetical protein